jgi:hypothetical protein
MAKSAIVNKFGKMVGWNDTKVNMLGRDVEGITAIEYDDTQELENIMGAGSKPIGRGTGNYQAKASITLHKEEVVALQRSLAPGARLSSIAPFDVTVHYEYQGFMYKDRIRNCQFKGNGVSVKQGDKSMPQKFDLIISHIDWNIA